jgi:hypothetical protein
MCCCCCCCCECRHANISHEIIKIACQALLSPALPPAAFDSFAPPSWSNLATNFLRNKVTSNPKPAAPRSLSPLPLTPFPKVPEWSSKYIRYNDLAAVFEALPKRDKITRKIDDKIAHDLDAAASKLGSPGPTSGQIVVPDESLAAPQVQSRRRLSVSQAVGACCYIFVICEADCR